MPTPSSAARPPPAGPARTVLKLGKRLSGAAPLKWKASKCLKSSGGCRGLAARGREASRGLGVLDAGPAAGGRRAGSEMGSHRAILPPQPGDADGLLGCAARTEFLFPRHKVALAKPRARTAHLCASPPHNWGSRSRGSTEEGGPPVLTEAQMNASGEPGQGRGQRHQGRPPTHTAPWRLHMSWVSSLLQIKPKPRRPGER